MSTLTNLLCCPITALRARSPLTYLFDRSWRFSPRCLTFKVLAAVLRGAQ